MSLFKFAVLSVIFQCVVGYAFTDVFYPYLSLIMMISCVIVLYVADMGSMERSEGFKMFYLTYTVAQFYFFSLSVLGVLYEFMSKFDIMFLGYPVGFLNDQYLPITLSLTILSLLSPTLTPITRNTGAFGGMVGRFINLLYGFALLSPLHKDRI